MKRIIALSALTGILTVTGCSTFKGLIGQDETGMHDTHSTYGDTAPVDSKNGVLVDAANHMTLYTYDKDTMNKSECGSVCMVAWPPFMAPADAEASGEFDAFKRKDGKYQWAMNGKPLYFYANDTKAGDMNGNGKFEVWHVVPTK